MFTWTKTDCYYSKILVFENPGDKTPMLFHKERIKSWFVNNGMFRLRWIDTKDGKLYEKEMKQGHVHHIPELTPHSLECLSAGSAMAETGNNDNPSDIYKLIPANNIGNQDES